MQANELNMETIFKQVCKIVKRAYKNINKLKSNVVENKELNDIVSFADKAMEKEIVFNLKKLFTSHSFIGEEFGQDGQKGEYEWLIDPIDGTINYVAGIPLYGTSVALRKNKKTILGVIFDWQNKDIYHSIKDLGAYKNKEKIFVSSTNKLQDSIITFCLTSHYNEEHTKQVLNIAQKLSSKVRGLRLVVCGTIELAWLATGRIDGMLNVKPSIGLSSCAGKLIVEEAGGKVTNLRGEKQKDKDTLLISNGLIHCEILQNL